MRQLFTTLGIKIPIVQAPMGGAVPVRLAAAVSNAGALGTLPLWRADLETLRGTVRKMRGLTSKPFAVNLVTEFSQQERLEVCLEEGVPIISFFWRDPGALVKRAKAGGAHVMYTVGNADDARRAVDSGVDVIVAQGWEAGGHVRGTVATLPLVPAIVDAVGDTPVIAAGGIADGRGMAAALALGAAGVWVGTRFLASEEVSIHPEYQRRILAASENDTAYCENLFDGGWANAPHRVLRNSTADVQPRPASSMTLPRLTPSPSSAILPSALSYGVNRSDRRLPLQSQRKGRSPAWFSKLPSPQQSMSARGTIGSCQCGYS